VCPLTVHAAAVGSSPAAASACSTTPVELGSVPLPAMYGNPPSLSCSECRNGSGSWVGVTPAACSACMASAVLFESSPVNVVRFVAGHGVDRSERYAAQPPSAHCCLTNQVSAV